jgi:hypothetical protein
LHEKKKLFFSFLLSPSQIILFRARS